MQRESLTNSFPISLFTHGSRRTCENVPENVGSALHEAIDFIRVFAYFAVCQTASKKAKIQAVLTAMFTRFFFPKKRQTQARYLFKQGRTAWRIVLERLVDGNNF